MIRKNSKGTVVIGATKSDAHVVSLYLIKLLLTEHGYDVINKSCMNSTEELLEDPGVSDLVAIIICNQNGQSLNDLADLKQVKARRQVHIPIIVGGHYHLGCGSRDRTDRILQDRGVDYILQDTDQILPLLDALATETATMGMAENAA